MCRVSPDGAHSFRARTSRATLTSAIDSTTFSTIVDARRLAKIAAEMKALRKRGGVTAADLEAVATSLGRTCKPGAGSHMKWLSAFIGVRPTIIPRHAGDMKQKTKNSILDVLEEDLLCYETEFREGEEENK
jgi:hypothetical protein